MSKMSTKQTYKVCLAFAATNVSAQRALHLRQAIHILLFEKRLGWKCQPSFFITTPPIDKVVIFQLP